LDEEETMVDILHRVPIKVPREAVYRAITEPDGLSSWWTSEVEAEAREGTISVFRFEAGQVQMRMRVKSLTPGRRVHWLVEEPSPPEWKGTEVTWDLSENGGGTSVLFGHRGWTSTEQSFASINYSWGCYLLSLVKYLEEGKGFPHNKPAG